MLQMLQMLRVVSSSPSNNLVDCLMPCCRAEQLLSVWWCLQMSWEAGELIPLLHTAVVLSYELAGWLAYPAAAYCDCTVI